MDSEDDFISDGSSQGDILDMQGSDDESLGDGKLIILTSCLISFFASFFPF